MISLQNMQYFILAICKLFSVDIQNLYFFLFNSIKMILLKHTKLYKVIYTRVTHFYIL